MTRYTNYISKTHKKIKSLVVNITADKSKLGMVAAVFGFLSFALMDFNNKNIMQYMHPITVGFLVNLATTLVVFLIASIIGIHSLKPHSYILHLGRAVLGVVSIYGGFTAISVLNISTFYSIIFISPLLSIAMAAVLLKETPTHIQTTGVIFGFIGIIIIFRPTNLDFNYGYLLALSVAFCIAINGIWLKRFMSDIIHPLSVIFYNSLIVSIALAYPALSKFHSTSWRVYLLIMLSAIFYIIASFLVVYAIKNIALYLLGSIQYTQILWGFLIEAVFFAIWPNVWVLLGTFFIVFGGILVSSPQLLARIFSKINKKGQIIKK